MKQKNMPTIILGPLQDCGAAELPISDSCKSQNLDFVLDIFTQVPQQDRLCQIPFNHVHLCLRIWVFLFVENLEE